MSRRWFTALAGMAGGLATPALALDAFPGAEGHGRAARGGRGGQIIQVTTLADTGPGSLRACIAARGPRVCVFRVAGVIRFTTARPIIANPYLTIAGQTAPGGGIVLTHGGGPIGLTPLVVKNTNDVVIRHLRVRTDRRGDDRAANSAFIVENSRQVILDHVSASWAIDENFGGYGRNDNITVSSSIFAEGVPRHDKCALLASDPVGPQRLSFVRNLCAHNGDRNPDINFPPRSCVEVVNNVLYNAVAEFSEVWESYGGTPASIIGNYYRTGPNTARGAAAITRQWIGSKGRARIHEAGNRLDGGIALFAPGTARYLAKAPACPLASRVTPARTAYREVLAASGAFPRDATDRRIVGEVRTRTGRIREAPGEIGPIDAAPPYADGDRDGMADTWETAHGTDPAVADPWGDVDGDGWPNLDEFLDHAHRRALRSG